VCREIPEVAFSDTENTIRAEIDLKFWDEFRVSGLPMRVHVTAASGGKIIGAWGGNHPWKSRLTHGSYNPDDSGWLLGI